MKLGRIMPTAEANVRGGKTPNNHSWLNRLCKRGEGPPRIAIDGKSWGYPEIPFEEWLRSRLENPVATS